MKRSILFIICSLTVGGSEKKLVSVLKELYNRYDVHLCYLNNPDTLLPFIPSNVSVFCGNRKKKFDWYTLQLLRSYIEKHNIQKIFCINLYPSLYAYLLKKIYLKDIEYYVFVNTSIFRNLKEKLFMYFYKITLKNSKLIIFGSKKQKQEWIKKYHLPENKCYVIYNGVDLKYFNKNIIDEYQIEKFRKKYNIKKDDLIIGSVGRLAYEKGYTYLLEACARLLKFYSFKILLVGDGPLKDELITLAKRLNVLNNLILWGQTLEVRIPLALIDIFVLPSIAVETFSNAALEAMAMELPVVLSDVGGAREIVQEGVNGFVFPPRDTEVLAGALETLIKDTKRRYQMGINARRIVEEHFSLDKMVSEYKRLIDE